MADAADKLAEEYGIDPRGIPPKIRQILNDQAARIETLEPS